jgi:predicted O-methyltransferase YrrM
MVPMVGPELTRLQGDIVAASRTYQPPADVLSRVDEEYRAYLTNVDGRSFYYQWLAVAVRLLKPSLVVELGGGLGASTLMMLSELPVTGRLVTCDLRPTLKFVSASAMRDARFRFVSGNDLDLSIFGDEPPIGIELLFIDTDHTLVQLAAEWSVYRHLCNPGALVVLDDILMNDLPRFWETLPYPKLDLTRECHFSGFGLFRYETEVRPNLLEAYRAALRIAWARPVDRTEASGRRPTLAGLFRRGGRGGRWANRPWRRRPGGRAGAAFRTRPSPSSSLCITRPTACGSASCPFWGRTSVPWRSSLSTMGHGTSRRASARSWA